MSLRKKQSILIAKILGGKEGKNYFGTIEEYLPAFAALRGTQSGIHGKKGGKARCDQQHLLRKHEGEGREEGSITDATLSEVIVRQGKKRTVGLRAKKGGRDASSSISSAKKSIKQEKGGRNSAIPFEKMETFNRQAERKGCGQWKKKGRSR